MHKTLQGFVSKKILLIIGIVLAASVVIVIMFFFMLSAFAPRTASNTSSILGLPIFGNTPSGTTEIPTPTGSSAGTSTTQVLLSNGSSANVRDFLHDTGVQLIGENDPYGYYAVVGNQEKNISTSSLPYRINYWLVDKSFGIYLAREPLGEVRRSAAEDLRIRLGLTPKELCSLAVDVGTSDDVNSFLGAQNLGLPGCPGAYRFDGDPNL